MSDKWDDWVEDHFIFYNLSHAYQIDSCVGCWWLKFPSLQLIIISACTQKENLKCIRQFIKKLNKIV